jgi:dihydrofolate synthase/folylpolyglutamate synthase
MSLSAYRDALGFIYGLSNLEAAGSRAAEHFDLSRMERLLTELGSPETQFKSVHVAGTKGKGSVCAMLESILRSAGHRTGLYISPHLHTFRERIRVAGEYISEDEFGSWVDRIKPLVAAIPGTSTFEAATAIGLAHFARQDVDIAVLEVGLGGRLDATNVVTPLVSVITSISRDHTDVLGDTLAKIAYEKAGIIKPGISVVSAPQPAEALQVIQAMSTEREAPLTLVGRDWCWQSIRADLDGQTFSLLRNGSPVAAYSSLSIPLLGDHQLINATTAVAAGAVLRDSGVGISEDAVRDGLKQVHWPARLEILGRQPLVIIDGAHNDESCRRLAQAIRDHFDYNRVVAIFGTSADKDNAAMLEALRGLEPSTVIISRADHPRATVPAVLRSIAQSFGLHCLIIPSTTDALDRALSLAAKDDLICACGSLFVAAEIREAWMVRAGLPLPLKDPVDM